MKILKKKYWKIFWVTLTVIAGLGLIVGSLLPFLLYLIK